MSSIDDGDDVVEVSSTPAPPPQEESPATSQGPRNRRGQSSICWEFFRVKNSDESVAVCKCGKEFSRGSSVKGKTSFSTSNMTRHLRNHHASEFDTAGDNS